MKQTPSPRPLMTNVITKLTNPGERISSYRSQTKTLPHNGDESIDRTISEKIPTDGQSRHASDPVMQLLTISPANKPGRSISREGCS
jgi:hypothetical protein